MKATSRLTGLTMLAITMASMWYVGSAGNDASGVFVDPVSISATR